MRTMFPEPYRVLGALQARPLVPTTTLRRGSHRSRLGAQSASRGPMRMSLACSQRLTEAGSAAPFVSLRMLVPHPVHTALEQLLDKEVRIVLAIPREALIVTSCQGAQYGKGKERTTCVVERPADTPQPGARGHHHGDKSRDGLHP